VKPKADTHYPYAVRTGHLYGPYVRVTKMHPFSVIFILRATMLINLNLNVKSESAYTVPHRMPIQGSAKHPAIGRYWKGRRFQDACDSSTLNKFFITFRPNFVDVYATSYHLIARCGLYSASAPSPRGRLLSTLALRELRCCEIFFHKKYAKSNGEKKFESDQYLAKLLINETKRNDRGYLRAPKS